MAEDKLYKKYMVAIKKKSHLRSKEDEEALILYLKKRLPITLQDETVMLQGKKNPQENWQTIVQCSRENARFFIALVTALNHNKFQYLNLGQCHKLYNEANQTSIKRNTIQRRMSDFSKSGLIVISKQGKFNKYRLGLTQKAITAATEFAKEKLGVKNI